MDPMTIAALASLASTAIGAATKGGPEAPPMPEMNIDTETGTDKWAKTIRSLNEGGKYNRDRLFADEASKQFAKLPTLNPQDVQGVKDYSGISKPPSGNVYDQGGAEGGGGEGGGGFNMDNALQYAALAAQLGSMFAPPPPPPAPRAGGGMNINAQPYTLRMMRGG
jgi:hypothetical protein